MSSVHLEDSHIVGVRVEEAFDRVLPLPLEKLFTRRYGPIPAIKHTQLSGPAEPWGTVGQSRRLVFADPGSVQERLTVVERPHRFGYVLSDIKGPMKMLVSKIEGMWSFDADGEGTRITWSWEVHPANAVGRLAMPVFARLWRGYARQSLIRLESLVTSPRRS